MMSAKLFVAILAVSLMSVVASAHEENKSPQAQAVDGSCTSEAATAGCGAEKVGTGLLICMHKYKKAHSEFKFSDGCKTAMKAMRAARHGQK